MTAEIVATARLVVVPHDKCVPCSIAGDQLEAFSAGFLLAKADLLIELCEVCKGRFILAARKTGAIVHDNEGKSS